MSKTSTDLVRHALNGATMGTRWSALFFAAQSFDVAPLHAALQDAVTEVDEQMSVWKPDSGLMRINRAPPGEWIDVPAQLVALLRRSLAIGRASGGAFDIGVGDAAAAWGFGPEAAADARIRAALAATRRPCWEVLEIEEDRVRKHAMVTLDLNGIAKGHGTDRLADTLTAFGITSFLAGIDGEMRAAGLRPDGEAWTIAIEQPDPARRAAHSVLALADAAVATSGDYRHWVDVNGRRLSHTINPERGAPLAQSPASVTVVAGTCEEADAWATALMVLGPATGVAIAERMGLDALFLMRGAGNVIAARAAGTLFAGTASARRQ